MLAEDEQPIMPTIAAEENSAESSSLPALPEVPVQESPVVPAEELPALPEELVIPAQELPAPDYNSPTEQPSLLPEVTGTMEESLSNISTTPTMPTVSETNSGATTETPRQNPITILENQLSIKGVTVDALFTKDGNQELREIQIQDEAVISSDIGITITIPQDTRIFAPSPAQPLILESSFELPLEEELNQIIEDVNSGVTVITTIEKDPVNT